MKKSTEAEVAISEWPSHDWVEEGFHFSEQLCDFELGLPPIGYLLYVESFESLFETLSNRFRDHSDLVYFAQESLMC